MGTINKNNRVRNFRLTIILVCICSLSLFAQTNVTFNLKKSEGSNYKYVGIRGDKQPLSWETSVQMKKVGDGYTANVSFDTSIENIQFKYVLYDSDKKVQWEALTNRVLKIDSKNKIILNHQWNTEEAVDISTLKKITSDDLLKDFELIKTMVLEVHPGTYRYNSKESITAKLEKLKQTFQTDLSYGEAYLAISKLLGSVQCDHTFASFYNQGPILKTVIHNQRNKLPFTFSWVGDKMIVVYDVSSKNLQRGTEIISINGVSTKEVLERLKPYVKADGATDKSRVKQLEVKGYPYRYNGFDVFHPLVYQVEDKFTLEVKTPTGKEHTIQVAALTLEERTEKLKDNFSDFAFTKEKLWGYEKLKNNIGLLKAGTFDDYGMDRDWRKYFSSTFKQIRSDGIEHLIVDLRENQGGFDEIGLGLMQHLIKKPGKVEDFISKSRYKNFPESLKPYAKSWGEPWFHSLKVVSEKDENGYYSLPEEKAVVVKPAKNAFKGDVYFLVGPANVSMAFYIANATKKYNIGTLVGEETGGNQRGINGGQILFLRLPNSEIEIDFPVEGSFSRKRDLPNKGILPDVKIATSLDYIKSGRDAQLLAALQLIKSNGNE
ncbi:S41 family peptidase [uncultured Croceitalea sp.]|uniref:S41 family peptidase n=1 Tax=uncultured Croceitalea sp. TaxID=1798908 RepID=UPI0033061457